MQEIGRPLPVPNPLTQPFWDAAKEGKLVIQRCGTCGTYYHPPVLMCARCLASGSGSKLAFEQVSGRGTVYSHTLIHDTRLRGFEKITPYPVVLVELEEQQGLILNANMPDTKVEDIRSGAPVEVTFIDIGSGFMLPEFHLARRRHTLR